MSQPHLLCISGSLRKEATNRKLLREAVRLFGDAVSQDADLKLPLYDGDVEKEFGIPPLVQQLAEQIKAVDAVLISTPEYNKSVSGVLKNALDWVSRVDGNPWRDKPVAVMSAAAGRAGGESAQFALRSNLVPFRPMVMAGPSVMIAGSGRAFDDNGRLTDERSLNNLTELMEELRVAIPS